MISEEDIKKSTIAELVNKIKRQAEQLKRKDEVLRRKNLELDALHMIWCSGTCENGVHRWTDTEITSEMKDFIWRYLCRFMTKCGNLEYSKYYDNKDPHFNYRLRQLLSNRIWTMDDDKLQKLAKIILEPSEE